MSAEQQARDARLQRLNRLTERLAAIDPRGTDSAAVDEIKAVLEDLIQIWGEVLREA